MRFFLRFLSIFLGFWVFFFFIGEFPKLVVIIAVVILVAVLSLAIAAATQDQN